MQVPTLGSALQTGLAGINRGMDGVQKAAGEIAGSGKTESASLASGRSDSGQGAQSLEESLADLTVSKNTVAASVKVVTAADEVMGTTLGLNVDTYA